MEWIANATTAPEKFINEFMGGENVSQDVMEALRNTFMCGYCYYFATILIGMVFFVFFENNLIN